MGAMHLFGKMNFAVAPALLHAQAGRCMKLTMAIPGELGNRIKLCV